MKRQKAVATQRRHRSPNTTSPVSFPGRPTHDITKEIAWRPVRRHVESHRSLPPILDGIDLIKPMRLETQRTSSTTKSLDRVGNITYWLTVALLVGVPLAFSTAAYRMYSAPKFSLLLSGAAALVPLLTWTMTRTPNRASEMRRLLASRHVLLVSLYLIVIVISTCWGVSPVASFFGRSYAQMGLLTRLSFFVVFISLIALVSRSEKRLSAVLWAMALTGLAVATYAFMQFFGKDLFTQSELYTFQGEGEALLRVNSTIGNSNYLGISRGTGWTPSSRI